MAYPTTSMSSTTLATSIPLLWGEKINEFFKLKLLIADFFVDRSSELAGGGSALYTPNLTEFGANAKTNATAVKLAALTYLLKQSMMSLYEMLYMQPNSKQTA